MRRMVRATMLLVTLIPASVAGAARVDGAPTRLVSADAGITEILILLGVEARLVAVDSSSRLPDSIVLPRLGYHRALAAEGILGLNPDLVIGTEVMGPPHVIDALERAKVPVLRLPVADSLVTLRNNVTRVAEAVGSKGGNRLIETLDRLAEGASVASLDGISGAFLLRAEGGKLRLAGEGTAGAGFLSLLGASNVADYNGYRSITPEGLLALEPAVLILADTGRGGTADLLNHFPVLRFSSAVQANRIQTVDPETLVAGISPSALDEAARILSELRLVAR